MIDLTRNSKDRDYWGDGSELLYEQLPEFGFESSAECSKMSEEDPLDDPIDAGCECEGCTWFRAIEYLISNVESVDRFRMDTETNRIDLTIDQRRALQDMAELKYLDQAHDELNRLGIKLRWSPDPRRQRLAGRDFASDMKRQIVKAVEDVGLRAFSASARLMDGELSRIIDVQASPPDWTGTQHILHVYGILASSGQWELELEVVCYAAEAPFTVDGNEVNGWGMWCPHNQRKGVAVEGLPKVLPEMLFQRALAIRYCKEGKPEPYEIDGQTWQASWKYGNQVCGRVGGELSE